MNDNRRSILEGDDTLGRYLLKRMIHNTLEIYLKKLDAEKCHTEVHIGIGDEVLRKVILIYGSEP